MKIRIEVLCFMALSACNAPVWAQTAVQPALGQRAPASFIVRGPEADGLPAQPTVEADRTPSPASSPEAGLGQVPSWVAERRACEACPPRSVGKALLHATIINGFYETANLIRGQDTAKITPKTWWANMQRGWEWDLDDFIVNQVGHPYQGNNYFNAARSNGLSFWESAAVTAFGSGTWEYFGETNQPSLNDLINTTMGGIAFGEMFHRAAWLVRNPRATGRTRLWNEVAAAMLDPVTGANRFITGDAARVTDKPAEMVPTALDGFGSSGVLWRGSKTRAVHANGEPFLQVDMLYGDPETGRSRTPYDAFTVRLRFEGGAGFSEAKIRGRLAGQPFRNGKLQFSVLQSYFYESNDAYSTGAQSIEGAFGVTQQLSPRTSVWFLGWGGLTVLGAVDSLPLGVTEPPPEEPETEQGQQGVSTGPRFYDYGPGSNVGATASFLRDNRAFATVFYEGRQLYPLDGVRANHFLQRMRLELLAPLKGRLGIGLAGEYFIRTTYFQDANRTIERFNYPQISTYLTWRPR